MRMPSVCSTTQRALVGGVAFDNLDVDADRGAVLDDGLLETLVNQGLLDGVDGGDLAECDAERVVVGASSQHGRGDDQAEDVDRQFALATRHLLGRVPPGRGRRDVDRRVDGLRVDHDQARVLRPPGLLPNLPAQQAVDLRVRAVVAPGREVVADGRLRRQVVREIIPLAAGPTLVQNRVDDLPHLVAALMPGQRRVVGLPRQDHRLDQRPPLIEQVALVGLAVTHSDSPAGPSRATGPNRPNPHERATTRRSCRIKTSSQPGASVIAGPPSPASPGASAGTAPGDRWGRLRWAGVCCARRRSR